MTRRVEVLLSSESNTRAFWGPHGGGPPSENMVKSKKLLSVATYSTYDCQTCIGKKLDHIVNIHRDEVS